MKWLALHPLNDFMTKTPDKSVIMSTNRQTAIWALFSKPVFRSGSVLINPNSSQRIQSKMDRKDSFMCNSMPLAQRMICKHIYGIVHSRREVFKKSVAIHLTFLYVERIIHLSQQNM